MMMLVAAAVAAVMMQDGSSYYHSSGSLKTEDGSITTATEGLVVGMQGKKTAMTTPTPTLQTVIAQYPELNDYSPEDQEFQYQAYLLYLNGMTSEELDTYYNINGRTSLFRFSCCLDRSTSAGCIVRYRIPQQNIIRSCDAINDRNGCRWAGVNTNGVCCRHDPMFSGGVRRTGRRWGFWEPCVQ